MVTAAEVLVGPSPIDFDRAEKSAIEPVHQRIEAFTPVKHPDVPSSKSEKLHAPAYFTLQSLAVTTGPHVPMTQRRLDLSASSRLTQPLRYSQFPIADGPHRCRYFGVSDRASSRRSGRRTCQGRQRPASEAAGAVVSEVEKVLADCWE